MHLAILLNTDEYNDSFRRSFQSLYNRASSAKEMVCDLSRVRWRNWNRDISELPNVSVSKRVLLQNLSNDNELDLHGNKRVDERQEYSIWNRDKKQHRNGLFLNHFAMVKQQVKFRKILSAVWYCDTPFNILRNFVRVSLSFVRKFRTKQVVRRICEA